MLGTIFHASLSLMNLFYNCNPRENAREQKYLTMLRQDGLFRTLWRFSLQINRGIVLIRPPLTLISLKIHRSHIHDRVTSMTNRSVTYRKKIFSTRALTKRSKWSRNFVRFWNSSRGTRNSRIVRRSSFPDVICSIKLFYPQLFPR